MIEITFDKQDQLEAAEAAIEILIMQLCLPYRNNPGLKPVSDLKKMLVGKIDESLSFKENLGFLMQNLDLYLTINFKNEKL